MSRRERSARRLVMVRIDRRGTGPVLCLFIARVGASAPVAEGREEEEATAVVHLSRGDEHAGEGWEGGGAAGAVEGGGGPLGFRVAGTSNGRRP